MKKIEAIIRSSKFEDVKDALAEIDVNFFTFSEVKGYGKQQGKHVVYRGAVYDVGYIARLNWKLSFLKIKRKPLWRPFNLLHTPVRSGTEKSSLFQLKKL